jgi:hypothetical protein
MRTDRHKYGHPLALETLESRRCLTVSAVASAGGDLLISGTPDGAVETVAVSAETSGVTATGVVVADEPTLTGGEQPTAGGGDRFDSFRFAGRSRFFVQ